VGTRARYWLFGLALGFVLPILIQQIAASDGRSSAGHCATDETMLASLLGFGSMVMLGEIVARTRRPPKKRTSPLEDLS
jgi:hypothetical protein